MRARIAGRVLLLVAVVGIAAGWAAMVDRPVWVKISLAAVAAVVAAFAPVYVEWLRGWAAARRKASAVGERARPDTPSGLLRADRGVVPFQGRAGELDELKDWCRHGNSPVRLVVGAGGVGKTRLALRLCDHFRACGWVVGVVDVGQETNALTDLRATTRRPILLVVDYAETRSGVLELLRSVPALSGHVRVLLIARGVGDWWRRLESASSEVRTLVRAYRPMELATGVDSTSKTELVHEAMKHFAKALGVSTPQNVEVEVPGEVPLLVLHAAALVAVLRHQRPGERTHPEKLVVHLGVLDELLGHEWRYWEQSAAQNGLGDLGSEALRRVVAVACLVPAADEDDGAEILRRVPGLADAPELQRRQIAQWLKHLYPGEPGYWGAPQPELVTEAHVVDQVGKRPDLVTNLASLRPEQTRHLLTVLSLAVAHRPTDRHLLEEVLRSDLENLVFPALTVATVSGGGLPKALASVLDRQALQLDLLRRIDCDIPYPTTTLHAAAVVVVRRILKTFPAGSEPGEALRWRARLGVLEAQAGRPRAALRHSRAAVQGYRTLAQSGRAGPTPELARSLHSLGLRYAERRDYRAALDNTREAEAIYRDLRCGETYEPELAACLNNAGSWLIELGEHSDARTSLQAAVDYYGSLARGGGGRFRGDLATAMASLELCAATPSADESDLRQAVEECAARFEDDPSRWRAELAQTRHTLAERLVQLAQAHVELAREHAELAHAELAREHADLAHAELALAHTELTAALHHYRVLTEANEGRFKPDLAACLNNLGVVLHRLDHDHDHDADAERHAREAVTLNEALARANARFQPELGRSSDNLGLILARQGRHAEAIPHAMRAVRVYAEAAQLHREADQARASVEVADNGPRKTGVPRYQPEHAAALTNLGVCLSELGRHAEALPLAEKAVRICAELAKLTELTESDRDRYRRQYARALDNLAVDLSALRRHPDAERRRQDAYKIRLGLGDVGPARQRWWPVRAPTPAKQALGR